MFIYPVKRDAGHFTLIGQVQENVMVTEVDQLFAHLHDFRNKGMLTTPLMILVFFEELLKTKSMCLARADIVDNSLKKEEASRLFSQVLMFYGTAELYNRFVIPFNRDPEGFNYNDFTKLMDLSKY